MNKTRMKISSGTHIGLVRKRNEDNLGYIETPNGHLIIVCDGMGGHKGGDIASSIAVESIISFFNKEKYQSIELALYKSLETANRNIIQQAKANTDLHGMGTTATVAIIRDKKAYYAHIGDSRIYFIHQSKIARLTRDHSYVQSLVDQGVISEQDAEKHPKRNQIQKALGITNYIEPSISDVPLKLIKGDQLLLCSDGLFGLVNDRTIQATLSDDKLALEQKKDELIKLALRAGGNDNITLQLAEMNLSSARNTIVLSGLVLALVLIFLGGFMFYTPIKRNLNVFLHFQNDLTQNSKDDSLSEKIAINPGINTDKQLDSTVTENGKDNLENGETKENENMKASISGSAMPADTIYKTIKGDSWNLIYKKFGVCSCFIKDISENKEAYGKRYVFKDKPLIIPLRYSSKEEFNPEGFSEYNKPCKDQ
jgi:serine/threonine protein phosphatase PrpC